MDALALIIRTIRAQIEATGAPPDPIQAALEEAERRLRGSLGGGMHHISRARQPCTKERIAELGDEGLSTGQISERLGVSGRYVRRVLSQLRE